MPHKITLDNGKYTIVYDETNSFPEKILRYGEEWRNVVGDNLIYWLCNEIMSLRNSKINDLYDLPPIGGFHDWED